MKSCGVRVGWLYSGVFISTWLVLLRDNYCFEVAVSVIVVWLLLLTVIVISGGRQVCSCFHQTWYSLHKEKDFGWGWKRKKSSIMFVKFPSLIKDHLRFNPPATRWCVTSARSWWLLNNTRSSHPTFVTGKRSYSPKSSKYIASE